MNRPDFLSNDNLVAFTAAREMYVRESAAERILLVALITSLAVTSSPEDFELAVKIALEQADKTAAAFGEKPLFVNVGSVAHA